MTTQKEWALLLLSLGVLVCSLNFWRDPRAGWRRTVDIGLAQVAFVVNLAFALTCAARRSTLLVFGLLGISGVSFAWGRTILFPPLLRWGVERVLLSQPRNLGLAGLQISHL